MTSIREKKMYLNNLVSIQVYLLHQIPWCEQASKHNAILSLNEENHENQKISGPVFFKEAW